MLQGIRESPNRMASLGYPVSRAKFMAIVLSGLMAGVAGILAVWQVEFISPQIGSFARSANAVVMVILGGTGTIIGPLVGAGVVVGIEQWLSSYIERWPTLLGLVLVLVVLFAPRGIVGTLADLARRRSPAMGGAGTPGGPPPSQAVAPGSGAPTTMVGARVSPDHGQKEAGP
jgi:branched-chain amino acid transport system permease protein